MYILYLQFKKNDCLIRRDATQPLGFFLRAIPVLNYQIFFIKVIDIFNQILPLSLLTTVNNPSGNQPRAQERVIVTHS
jgi:hypothetical protein